MSALRRSGASEEAVSHFEEALEDEARHLSQMEALLCEHNVRPSALLPMWRICAFLSARLTVRLGVDVAFFVYTCC